MISEDKISKFMTLLISQTRKGIIKWKIEQSQNINSLEGEDRLLGRIFTTEFQGKNLRLYKFDSPIREEEDLFIYYSFIKLEFIDEKENSIWRIPFATRELHDLYETVQIKSSDLDTFFNSF